VQQLHLFIVCRVCCLLDITEVLAFDRTFLILTHRLMRYLPVVLLACTCQRALQCNRDILYVESRLWAGSAVHWFVGRLHGMWDVFRRPSRVHHIKWQTSVDVPPLAVNVLRCKRLWLIYMYTLSYCCQQARNLQFLYELRRLFALMVASKRKYVDPSKSVEILKEAFSCGTNNSFSSSDNQQVMLSF